MIYKLLNRYIKIVGHVNEWIGQKIAWLTTILMLLICYDVVMRYFFNTSVAWVFELEWHLFAIIFLLGAAFTLKHDKHVRVDVFYARLNKKQQAWINLTGSLLFLLPFCLVMIDASFKFVENSYRFGESSPDPGGLPARYIIKSAILIGFFFLILQCISLIAKSLLIILNKLNPLNS